MGRLKLKNIVDLPIWIKGNLKRASLSPLGHRTTIPGLIRRRYYITEVELRVQCRLQLSLLGFEIFLSDIWDTFWQTFAWKKPLRPHNLRFCPFYTYPVNRLSTVIHIRICIPESIPTVHIGWIEVLFTAVGRIDFREKCPDSRREKKQTKLQCTWSVYLLNRWVRLLSQRRGFSSST